MFSQCPHWLSFQDMWFHLTCFFFSLDWGWAHAQSSPPRWGASKPSAVYYSLTRLASSWIRSLLWSQNHLTDRQSRPLGHLTHMYWAATMCRARCWIYGPEFRRICSLAIETHKSVYNRLLGKMYNPSDTKGTHKGSRRGGEGNASLALSGRCWEDSLDRVGELAGRYTKALRRVASVEEPEINPTYSGHTGLSETLWASHRWNSNSSFVCFWLFSYNKVELNQALEN